MAPLLQAACGLKQEGKNHKQLFVIFQKTRSHGLQPVEWFTFNKDNDRENKKFFQRVDF